MIKRRKTGITECVRRRRQGFTLLEVIITIVLVSFVGIMTLLYLAHISRLYTDLYAQRQVDGTALEAWNRLLREIRLWQTPVTADTNIMQFVNRLGSTNICIHSGGNITWNSNLLAEDVDHFVLTYYDATNGILAPTPLDSANRALIRRIGLDFAVSRNHISSKWNISFYINDGYTR
jgi:prepilin-type N-terminal cleavage/methylation domain-containing protein